MLRYIFRKKKQKERLWPDPKDNAVNGVVMDGTFCRDSEELPGLTDTGSESGDPTYSTIGDLGEEAAWSTFRGPDSTEEGGPPPSGQGSDKRASIVCVESDESPILDPNALYATVQRPPQTDKSQSHADVSDTIPGESHAEEGATDREKNVMSSAETDDPMATPPGGGNQGTDFSELSDDGFHFSISLMDELLADFQKFTELPLPELDEIAAPNPTRTILTPRPLSEDVDTFRVSEFLAEPPEVGYIGKVRSKSTPLLEALVDVKVGVLSQSPTLRKTVTFDDNIQQFERPQSLVTESDCTLEDTAVKVPLVDETPQLTVEPVFLPANGFLPKGAYAEMDDEILTITVSNPANLPPDDVSLDCLSVATDDDAYSDEEKEEPMRKPIIVRRFRGLRILLIILAWLIVGLACELSTVSFSRYSAGLNSTYEEIGRAYAAEGVGVVGGALLAGIVCSYIHGYPDAAILVALVTATGSLLTRPWARRLVYFICNLAGTGIAKGVLFVGGGSYVAKIQEENKCTVLMYIAFSVYNLGALCACQLTFIFTNVVFPPEVIGYLQHLGFPPTKETIRLYSNGNSTGDHSHDARAESEDSVFPWDVGGLMCMLMVGMGLLILALCFLCLMTYTLIQTGRKRKQGELIQKRERQKFKKDIKVMGNVESSEAKSKINGEFSSPTRVPLLQDQTDSESYTEPGFNKQDRFRDKTIHVDECQTASRNDTVSNHKSADRVPNGKLPNFDDDLAQAVQNGQRNSIIVAPHCNNHSEKVEAFPSKRKVVSFNVKEKRKRVRWFVGNQSFDIPMLMYLYVFFTMAAGSEMVIGRYLYEFITNTRMEISQKEATCLMMAFWGAGAVSRMLSLPVSRLVSPNAIMITCLTLSLVGLVVLGIYGNRLHVILWLFTALTGFALGPILPGGLTFANIYLNLVPKTIALAVAMAGFGAALFVWLGALVLHYFGYTAVLFFSVGMACLSALLFIPVLFNLTRKKLFRIKTPKTVEDYVVRKPSVTYL